MTTEQIYTEPVSISYDTEEHLFQIETIGAVCLDEREMLKLVTAVSEKLFDLVPLSVGDHVKVVGNSPETAWESGCIEHIEGCMAHIVYGVKNLYEFGGIRGMGVPVPLSQLRRI